MWFGKEAVGTVDERWLRSLGVATLPYFLRATRVLAASPGSRGALPFP
jgi:hypothetical protein